MLTPWEELEADKRQAQLDALNQKDAEVLDALLYNLLRQDPAFRRWPKKELIASARKLLVIGAIQLIKDGKTITLQLTDLGKRGL